MVKVLRPQSKDIEIAPDAWERFERAIDVVAKSPPQHRKSTETNQRRGKGKGAPVGNRKKKRGGSGS